MARRLKHDHHRALRFGAISVSSSIRSTKSSYVIAPAAHGRDLCRDPRPSLWNRKFMADLRTLMYARCMHKPSLGDGSANMKALISRAFVRADDGTRTHDLLHGKRQPWRPPCHPERRGELGHQRGLGSRVDEPAGTSPFESLISIVSPTLSFPRSRSAPGHDDAESTCPAITATSGSPGAGASWRTPRAPFRVTPFHQPTVSPSAGDGQELIATARSATRRLDLASC